jgi:hypothetical protein
MNQARFAVFSTLIARRLLGVVVFQGSISAELHLLTQALATFGGMPFYHPETQPERAVRLYA